MEYTKDELVLMTKADKKVVIFFHNMISVRFLPNGKR